ncbi:type II toxin-antitoxin system toxin DNA ADP-ribosyl transferase DarT [Kineococcus sp. G2]|uniref:type II toxin-antitoxin system toxin DNA ADP-ribosyl transferase DarT n=1 Tax=Kineococcus sp. G2 TaxID=3127484 RepID=UPI00301D2F53
MPRPQPTLVYHMTRIERLAGMVREGLLSDTECRRRGITGVGIGYSHLKERRAHRTVPCGAGGTLADYVRWYFAPRSPMLYAITKGQVGAEAAQTEEIVYVVSSTQRLREAGVTVVASDRHAVLQLARLSADDADLDGDDFVDWGLMEARMWAPTPDQPDRKERRQAECLAHPSVPWSAVAGVVTRTEEAARKVETVLRDCGGTTYVDVRPHWYF